MFLIAGCISVVGAIFYGVYGTGIEQPWNNIPDVQGNAACPILSLNHHHNDNKDGCKDEVIESV